MDRKRERDSIGQEGCELGLDAKDYQRYAMMAGGN
jgi:hypothetical protein